MPHETINQSLKIHLEKKTLQFLPRQDEAIKKKKKNFIYNVIDNNFI